MRHEPFGSAASGPSLVVPPLPGREEARHFLFLQSHPSRFGAEVADRLQRDGHRVSRINLSPGDWFFWYPRPATEYPGRLQDWRAFLEGYLARSAVTDVVYYADCRPYHAIARRVAEARGIRTFAYEYGYLRPDWITLEPGAMGVMSRFTADPARIRALARGLPPARPAARFTHAFAHEAFNEVVYNTAPVVLAPFRRHYRRDRYYHPLVEYPSHLPRMATAPFLVRRWRREFDRLASADGPVFLVGMQLQQDYQIRRNSPYRHVREMIEEVLGSFRANAPANARLVFRPHPLDTDLERWPVTVRRRAAALGIAERVSVIGAVRLSDVLERVAGVVVINSTLGMHALSEGVPVKPLSPTVYDLPGLTFQGPLDAFWTRAGPPDAALYADLVAVMAATIQVQGDFFDRAGRDAAVPEFARRLVDDTARRLGACEPAPPRLARARAAGVVTSDDVFPV